MPQSQAISRSRHLVLISALTAWSVYLQAGILPGWCLVSCGTTECPLKLHKTGSDWLQCHHQTSASIHQAFCVFLNLTVHLFAGYLEEFIPSTATARGLDTVMVPGTTPPQNTYMCVYIYLYAISLL